jgi:hypothetical protein
MQIVCKYDARQAERHTRWPEAADWWPDGLMPAVGLLIGRPLGQAVGRWDVYAAAALLLVTGPHWPSGA